MENLKIHGFDFKSIQQQLLTDNLLGSLQREVDVRADVFGAELIDNAGLVESLSHMDVDTRKYHRHAVAFAAIAKQLKVVNAGAR